MRTTLRYYGKMIAVIATVLAVLVAPAVVAIAQALRGVATPVEPTPPLVEEIES